MEIILSQLEFVWWVFSPLGLITVAAGVALLLSGLPGALLPNLEVTASVRRATRRQETFGLKAPGHHHRERMGA